MTKGKLVTAEGLQPYFKHDNVDDNDDDYDDNDDDSDDNDDADDNDDDNNEKRRKLVTCSLQRNCSLAAVGNTHCINSAPPTSAS